MGEEDGEDAGLLHHQAAPGQAPRHEQQPSTICLLINPKCPIEAPVERVLFEYTKQNDKTPPSPIISTQTLNHVTGNQSLIKNAIKGTIKNDNTIKGITVNHRFMSTSW